MLPLCSQLIGVGSGIAGFAALYHIAHRVWEHLSRAEPIDFYPLFRPFVIGFCVLNFMLVVQMINGFLQPTVVATSAMVNNSDAGIKALLAQKKRRSKIPMRGNCMFGLAARVTAINGTSTRTPKSLAARTRACWMGLATM